MRREYLNNDSVRVSLLVTELEVVSNSSLYPSQCDYHNILRLQQSPLSIEKAQEG